MKIKKQIEKDIGDAIASLSEDVQASISPDDNVQRALAIKALAEAYNLVHRGNKGK